jgi:3-oxoacyl-[acyl-carrier protein] reductase
VDLGLAGKVAFVTGASGGIGEELVRAFVGEGARVVAASRRPVAASEGVLPVTADVRDPAALAAAMDAAVAAFGRVDVCVANAGVWPPESLPLDAVSEARVREVVETDLLGAMWTARAFLASLRRTGPRTDGQGAALIFIGSTAGRFGEAGHAEYSASKAALRGLTLALKNEIVGIDPWARVNLVDPGWTVTPMAEESLRASGQIDTITRTMALRRVAATADVASAVLFFASPTMARHVTGEALTIAGGMEGRVLW